MNNDLNKTLRLGIDIHNRKYKVAYYHEEMTDDQIEEEMAPRRFLDWVKSHAETGKKIYSCYEAGPLDCTLHLDLKKLGVANRLIRYKNWDKQNDEVTPTKYSASELLEITCALS